MKLRSTQSEFALRVNTAKKLLLTAGSPEVARRLLVQRFRISERQAYRYLSVAEETSHPVQIPEEKVVFTVKLPSTLVQKVRETVEKQEMTISEWVEDALQNMLKEAKHTRGKEEKRS